MVLLKMLLCVVTLLTKLTLLHYNANSFKSETVVHSITQNIISDDEYIEIDLVVHVTRLSYVHFQSVAIGI